MAIRGLEEATMVTGIAGNTGTPRDLTRGLWAIVFWCLPIAVLIADGASRAGGGAWHAGVAAAAFTLMAAGCALNAARRGRTHCHVTGPVMLLAAFWYVLAAAGVVAPHSNDVSLAVLALAGLPFRAALPLGRYIGTRRHTWMESGAKRS